ncbi:hypothetical protein M3Y98_00948900 [Aphelenchoides besseyi]|nr:hypothetical protein M3Y98_00948900 [Aphelenchoides besseyi]KAI6194545.1 hypothetical protein M3Y96_01136400 [Aphelenchoides besseyi]
MSSTAVKTSTGLRAVITGASSGLGFHTLKRLCLSGSFDQIIGLGRKVEVAEQTLRNEFPTNETKVEFLSCDLSKPSEVRKTASKIREKLSSIDVLLNNAGIMAHPYAFTEDDLELHFAVNHLGHFLLTTLLLDMMANDSRIINVSSGFYKQCREVPTLQTVHAKYKPQLSPKLFYAQSKLANALFTKALSNHITRNAANLPTIKVMCVRPGFIRGTELGRYHNQYLRWLATPLIYLVAKDINFGTNTMVHLALASASELEDGKMYYNCAVEEYNELVTDEAAEQLWKLSESLLENGNTAAVVLLDKTNEINERQKQNLASEFKCVTAFPQPIDTDDFLTAKRFKLNVFTEDEKLLVSEGALSVVHVLHNSKNPNEEFEFETTIGDVKGRVGKHDFSTLIFPSLEIFTLDSHKQQLTEKLPTVADPNGVGKKIADLLPPGIMVNQLVYCPKLKYLLIALDQATSHEQFMSLKLPRDQLLLIDLEGTSVRAVIVTFHYIPASGSEEVQSVQELLPLISEPDYVVRVFDWGQSGDYTSSGDVQLVAASFWATVYNRTNNLKACQFHRRRAAEFRVELRDGAIEISGQSLVVFNGFISERCLQ